MRKERRRWSCFLRAMAIAAPLIFSTAFPAFAGLPKERPPGFTAGSTKFCGGEGLGALIGEIAEAARLSIEEAAGEAAKAATLAGLEREAAALALARRRQAETEELRREAAAAMARGRRGALMAALAGFAAGTAAALLIMGR